MVWEGGCDVLNGQVADLELPLVLGQLGEQLVQVPIQELRPAHSTYEYELYSSYIL